MKRRLSLLLAVAMLVLVLAACGPTTTTPSKEPGTAPSTDPSGSQPEQTVVKLQVGFENNMTEPIGKGLEKWKELVEQESGGSLVIELFPDSQLGNKNDLIDAMMLGETYINNADPAFFPDYGIPDLSILMGPYLTDSIEECQKLTDSDWFAGQCELAEAKGLKVLNATWITGTRQLLTNSQIEKVEDLKGVKMRASTNASHIKYFETWGSAAVPMNLGDVYQALQTGTIEGGDNPLSTLYGRKLHEVSKYLLMTDHLRVINMWVMSSDVYETLSPEHQEILIRTAKEAGDYFNDIQTESDTYYRELMEKDGVITTYPTDEALQGFKDAIQPFYQMESEFGWSAGLYDTVCAAMGK